MHRHFRDRDALAEVPPWQLGDREQLATVVGEEVATMLAAARLALTAEIDACRAAVAAGASSTGPN